MGRGGEGGGGEQGLVYVFFTLSRRRRGGSVCGVLFPAVMMTVVWGGWFFAFQGGYRSFVLSEDKQGCMQ